MRHAPADNVAAFKSLRFAVGRVGPGLCTSGLAGLGNVAARHRREDPDAALTLLDLASE
jgi:hypothetical protein